MQPSRCELRRHHRVIDERDGDQIGETVVGVLLAEDQRLVALFSTTDDAMSDVKHVDVHLFDIPRVESVRLLELERRLDGRL